MRMRRRLNEGVPVPLSRMFIGMQVHLKGTDFGCVWRIVGFEHDKQGETWLHLQTPISGKRSRARASRARYIRAQEPKKYSGFF
ncbi:Uncharacterised protein [Achromobacter aegrifaciens]|uniref:Uncharacterized protein n=2 Tax=Achromobacter aegrifaciens TaxID=1287736 RepID=A0AAD2J3E7_ACHAE|nr:Uncharacterised protein [Achromobacter aegrifaciens]